MDRLTSFFKNKLKGNSSNNINTTNNNRDNITCTNEKINNNIRMKSVLEIHHPLPRSVWATILSLLHPDSLVAIRFTCSYMYHETEQPSMWITSLARVNIPITALPALPPLPPPPFTSWRSFWMNKKNLTWKNIREKVQIVGRSVPAHLKPIDHNRVRCVLLGDCAAGKSCLLAQVVQPEYFKTGFCNSDTTIPHPTIGAAFACIPVLCSLPPLCSLQSPPPPLVPYPTSPHSRRALSSASPSSPSSTTPLPYNVMLEVWDTSGLHPRGDGYPIPARYLQTAEAVMIVYDVTAPATFYGVDVWRRVTLEFAPTAFMLLAALKVDMPRKVPQETAMQYAQEHSMAYVEISAKTKHNYTLPFLFFGCVGMNTFPSSLLPFLNDCDGLGEYIKE